MAEPQGESGGRLEQDPRRLRELLEHAEVGIYSVSADLREVLLINPAFEALFGRPGADFQANPRLWMEVIHPDDRAFVGDPLAELRAQGLARHLYRVCRPDGTIRWVLDQSRRVDDDAGRPERFDCFFTDVTRRRQAEEALRESELRFRLLADNAVDMIARLTLDGTYLYASTVAQSLLGYRPDELVGR